MKRLCLYVPVLLLLCIGSLALAARTTVNLNGKWQIAEGTMDVPPTKFTHSVAVPGLIDMATPKYKEVGVPSKLRDAFWYRRTFATPELLSQRAVLKINKAAYGTSVFLNGKHIGTHDPCFTPGYFDVTKHLAPEGKQNELLIRVGADPTKLPADVANGRDFEKKIYQPGIYDSVSLIFSGAPWIDSVQVVPDLENKTAGVFVRLASENMKSGNVRCIIREDKSGKIAGESSMAASDNKSSAGIELRIPLKNCRLWSPEDPFMYRVEVATEGDSFTTRFGMRTFAFDRESGRAMLNGKPYIMRGTNVCIFRFFEDSQRGALPWNRNWVARLHSSFRDMAWNSIRYCIGFPPEFWYDIADDQGFLIQDEFPVWAGGNAWPSHVTSETLAREYAEWLPEHWNHPCVVLWDAQNESVTTVTGAALSSVRDMDLSKRPWDNGWGEPQAPTDTYECHPYVFNNPNATIGVLANLLPNHDGNPRTNTEKNPMLINEYGWLWLTRDGNACTLTRDLYKNLLGEKNTIQQRRETYGKYLGHLTEYWRGTRRFAGVLHFCGLSYSRPDGQTSDHFINVKKLQYEPNFIRYVRDSFSTVGLCIDFHEEEVLEESLTTVPVSIINDNPEAVDCEIVFTVSKDDRAIRTSEQRCKVEGLGKETLIFSPDLKILKGGKYELVAELRTKGQPPVRSYRSLRIGSEEEMGLAFRKRASASSVASVDEGMHRPEAVVDGVLATRWSSEFKDGEWISIDLGEEKDISRVLIIWERAYAREYVIEVSDDGNTWKEVYRKNRAKGGREEASFPKTKCRYVRLKCVKRATKFGISMWELRVY